ncbi:MAG: peptide deformylase [Bacteroidales bacterium]|nr:peptide deformylase [Bacteroidales bacterium]
MILPVYIYGSPVLRKVARQIEQDEKGLDQFIQNLWDTMYHSDGVGLAAPQLGKSIQIFVVDGTQLENDDPALKEFKMTFINPEIIDRYGDEKTYEEGCLSIPEIREEIIRPEKILIRWYDADFNYHEEEFGGIGARIIQHEYDHLQGILFTDKVAPLKRRMLRGKLNAIAKGKFEVKYKVKIAK